MGLKLPALRSTVPSSSHAPAEFARLELPLLDLLCQFDSGDRYYLSFAKNASADMSLRRNAFITVMQAAELRDLNDLSRTRDSPKKWTLLVEA